MYILFHFYFILFSYFHFYFQVLFFSNLNLSHKFEYTCKNTRTQHEINIYVFIYLLFNYLNSIN
jgi:hypothetical protein